MSPTMTGYAWLTGAIVAEVLGTTFLQKSEQFSRLGPTVALAMFYAASFYFLSHALKTMPLGVAYAMWGALGIILTAAVGLIVFRQTLDLPALFGIGLIVGGVLVINLFSKSMAH